MADMKPKSLPHLILGDEKLAYIGAVAVESAFMENTVELMLWAAAGMNHRTGKFVTAGMQMDRKLDLLRQALKTCSYDAAETSKIIDLIADAKDAYAQRNSVIHGLWFPFRIVFDTPPSESDLQAGATALRMAKKPDSNEHGYLSSAKLKEIATSISRIHVQLAMFYKNHMEGSQGPSPEKSPSQSQPKKK
jgi:hypothetical protein